MVSSKEMGVYIESNADARVTKLLLDVFGIGTTLDQQ